MKKLSVEKIRLGKKTYYIVDGDVFMNEEQLDEYREFLVRQHREESGLLKRLLGTRRGNAIARWPRGLQLTYHVAKETFDNCQRLEPATAYDLVCYCLRKASADWQSVCGVRFKRVDAGDEPLFKVEYEKRMPYKALAFFPFRITSAEERRVLIGDGFFSAYKKLALQVGCMRHELGHVLGFRHREDIEVSDDVIPINQHGRYSVMDRKDAERWVTALDASGAREVYGGPDSLYEYFRVLP